jgi:hypothetical protein
MNRNRTSALVGVAAITMITLVAGCSNETAGESIPSGGDGLAAVAATTPPTATTTTTEPTPLDLDDFIATLRITDKQCFGDIGCNVTVEPSIEYVHSLDTLEGRSYSITLTISGDETGPVVTTIDGTGTEYDVTSVSLSTRATGVVPNAKVTDVQEY